MSGHRHATISLICMSTHKAMAARCLSYHQAAYGQPAIRALATAPLRRLALSVLFTITTNSYQTTCAVSKRTFNKRQHANARHSRVLTHHALRQTPWTETTLDRVPLDRDPLKRDTPDRGTPWTDAHLDRDTPGQRPLPPM